jgi:hypothetical protein
MACHVAAELAVPCPCACDHILYKPLDLGQQR